LYYIVLYLQLYGPYCSTLLSTIFLTEV